MPRYKIILNPTAGRGVAGKSVPQIEDLLRGHRLDFNLVLTERPWHARDLAEQAAKEGFDVVVSASGDGTANEVLNGLMQARAQGANKAAMGIIAVGTGNDFAYGMGVPIGLEAGCSALAEDYRRRVDVGLLKGGDYPDGRYFGNGVGVGFDAEAGFVAAKIRWLTGLLLYLVAALETIFIYYKAPKVRILYDDKQLIQPSLMVSIMNGQRMGGGFYMAPQGNPADGCFDLCIAETAGKGRILQLIPYFMKGTQATQKEVKTGQARKVTVTALEGTLPVHCDGETVCYAGSELVIELLPGAIEFVCRKPE